MKNVYSFLKPLPSLIASSINGMLYFGIEKKLIQYHFISENLVCVSKSFISLDQMLKEKLKFERSHKCFIKSNACAQKTLLAGFHIDLWKMTSFQIKFIKTILSRILYSLTK